MNAELLSLIMDFVVLIALGGTIYYAMRLSKALNNFRAHREALKGLILDLSTHIDKAQLSINNLKQTSDSAASDLDDVLHDARRMAEELKMINATGDALASRLERAAKDARNAPAAPASSSAASQNDGYYDANSVSDVGYEAPAREPSNLDMPSFFIKDADFDRGAEEEFNEEEFTSRAERELYEALQGKKK